MARLTDHLFARAAARGIPLSGTFELSPLCNFQCRMCYVRQTAAEMRSAGRSLIGYEAWLALAEACQEAGMLYLLLTGGEPFAYPGFRTLYEALHDRHLLLSINTNGSLIDADTVAWLKRRAPRRVNVTLYGASPDTYGRLCGHSDGYDHTVGALRALKEAGITVAVNISPVPENVHELEAMVAVARELDLPCRINTYLFPPVRRDAEATDTRFTPEDAAALYLRCMRCDRTAVPYETRLARLVEEVDQAALAGHAMPPSADDSRSWGTPDADVAETADHMVCRAGRSSFWVSWDGKLTACGMMPFPLSLDPFARPFASCWQELTQAVQAATVLRGCRGCPKRELCHPCVAKLVAETGDANEKAPYACAVADAVYALARREVQTRSSLGREQPNVRR